MLRFQYGDHCAHVAAYYYHRADNVPVMHQGKWRNRETVREENYVLYSTGQFYDECSHRSQRGWMKTFVGE